MFELVFSTSNAAFDDLEHEVAIILRGLANHIIDNPGGPYGIIRDSNGITVGHWKLTKE